MAGDQAEGLSHAGRLDWTGTSLATSPQPGPPPGVLTACLRRLGLRRRGSLPPPRTTSLWPQAPHGLPVPSCPLSSASPPARQACLSPGPAGAVL